MPKLKILVVIVLYHRNLEASEAFQSLSQNNDLDFFIHCNSSDCIASANSRTIIYEDYTNPGVSKAYNRAAEFAKINSYNYLLLADQDTSFPDNYLHEFEIAQKQHQHEKLFIPIVKAQNKIISPLSFKLGRAWYLNPLPKTGLIRLGKIKAINTGLLIDVETFHQAGGYEEHVFLDYSDFVFLDRFIQIRPTAILLPKIIEGDLSDFKSDWHQAWKRYGLFLKSTKSLIFRKNYQLLIFWYLWKALKILKILLKSKFGQK